MDVDKKFRFRKFPVYQAARIFNREMKQLAMQNFPTEERYLLTSQLNRALDSIVLNIAEGADRSTDKDFAHFLNNSHTSINEIVACIDIARDSHYIDEQIQTDWVNRAAALANQVTAFRKTLIEADN